jgi:DNA-binding NtrC family response regulator
MDRQDHLHTFTIGSNGSLSQGGSEQPRLSDGRPTLADDWPTLSTLERRYIDQVLARTKGNKTRAAKVLGIDRRTLNRMFARERSKKA